MCPTFSFPNKYYYYRFHLHCSGLSAEHYLQILRFRSAIHSRRTALLSQPFLSSHKAEALVQTLIIMMTDECNIFMSLMNPTWLLLNALQDSQSLQDSQFIALLTARFHCLFQNSSFVYSPQMMCLYLGPSLVCANLHTTSHTAYTASFFQFSWMLAFYNRFLSLLLTRIICHLCYLLLLKRHAAKKIFQIPS